MITSLLLFFFNEFLSEEWKIWAEYSGFESKGGKLKLIHFGLNDWSIILELSEYVGSIVINNLKSLCILFFAFSSLEK